MNRLNDQRGWISGTALFVVIIILVLGVVIVDGSALLFGKWQLQNGADAAAVAAAVSYHSDHNLKLAESEAQASLSEQVNGAVITSIEVSPAGTITLTAKKDASTVFVQHVSALKHMMHLQVTSTGTVPTL